jgi:hypothetical protein
MRLYEQKRINITFTKHLHQTKFEKCLLPFQHENSAFQAPIKIFYY